ncbi:hypothetical protein [Roseixanthobacter glucoisosaccharinicivorans]|uniref:hypothetical protein n=1 Tax=Roseixanthobacter glucoisosaccharinicivorans TaxID=3119923 RepID=UPI00372715DE
MVPVAEGPSAASVSILLERLRWPVKLVRWRAAKEIRMLLMHPSTGADVSSALLSWIETRRLESEVLSGLSVLLVTPAAHRPSFDLIRSAINYPSMASDFLLGETFGQTSHGWIEGHSGTAPDEFVAEPYFDRFKASHVPGALSHELQYLEERFDLPFTRQWGFEWSRIREALKTGYTRYPNYFGDFGLQREGIVGQFLQRQSEVYRSAHLRTLACAVTEWGIPFDDIAPFATYNVPILPDLFELEPQPRPGWLPTLDANALGNPVSLGNLAQAIVAAQPDDEWQTVQLRIPLDRSFSEFGELEISAFLASEDFELSPDQILRPGEHLHELDRYRFDGSRPLHAPRPSRGAAGVAFPVCCNEIPSIHGFWHGEYCHRGLSLPAPYCFERPTFRRATSSGLTAGIGGDIVGTFSIWHDAWTPMYGPNSATRCGSISRIKRTRLKGMSDRMGLGLGWFVRLSRVDKPVGGYERRPTDETAFYRD